MGGGGRNDLSEARGGLGLVGLVLGANGGRLDRLVDQDLLLGILAQIRLSWELADAVVLC